ncbi:hypothetical protein GCM10011391_26550 [Pullulanibacillus camelliae]|uniref:Flagellar protein n=1 Tax=Pullulanibacillus camelliae TaxID=1707096 RepID=A0A8J2YJ42_9BACL|nr:flagellar biosynthetic protein FliO [Pullulanibacillus camelliae]GGE46440.1 hypothetical protein GCM10011391_26550 [Pullulanibacillus camelliae]
MQAFSYKVLLCIGLALVLCLGGQTMSYAKTNCSENASVASTIENKCKSDDTKDTTPQKSTTQSTTTTNETKSPVWIFVKLVGAMIVIIGLIYILYRLVSKKTRAFQSYGTIKNVGGVAVGPNRSIQLIRIGDEILVVGVGDSVQLLKEIQDPEAVEALLAEEPSTDLIQKNVSRLLNWTKASTSSGENSRLTVFQEKLKDILSERKGKIDKHMRKDSKDE